MKIFIFISLSLLAACGSKGQLVPGTYISHAQSPYSVADDTLVISSDHQVSRRTGFRRLPKGSPEYKNKNYSATWDETRQTLQLTENGLIIQFEPNGLVVGGTKYHKL